MVGDSGDGKESSFAFPPSPLSPHPLKKSAFESVRFNTGAAMLLVPSQLWLLRRVDAQPHRQRIQHQERGTHHDQAHRDHL